MWKSRTQVTLKGLNGYVNWTFSMSGRGKSGLDGKFWKLSITMMDKDLWRGSGVWERGLFFFHTLKSSESFLCNPHSLPPTCGLWHFVCRPCHFEHWCHQFSPDWTLSPNKNIVGRLAFLFTLYLQSQRFCREGSDRSNCSVTENFHLCLSWWWMKMSSETTGAS